MGSLLTFVVKQYKIASYLWRNMASFTNNYIQCKCPAQELFFIIINDENSYAA